MSEVVSFHLVIAVVRASFVEHSIGLQMLVVDL